MIKAISESSYDSDSYQSMSDSQSQKDCDAACDEQVQKYDFVLMKDIESFEDVLKGIENVIDAQLNEGGINSLEERSESNEHQLHQSQLSDTSSQMSSEAKRMYTVTK